MGVRKKLLFIILILSITLLQKQSFGFSMGYHCDLIEEALSREQFDNRAIELVKACNEFTDLYATDESFMLIDDDLKSIKNLADIFHSTQLLNFQSVKKNTEMLIQNMAEIVAKNKQLMESDPSKESTAYTNILVAMGISIHCLGDFYAHSNWAELNMSAYSNIKDATLFDVMYGPEEWRSNAIAAFLQRGFPKSEHGIYSIYSRSDAPVPMHNDIYKDFAYRANFDDAYRTAFKATLEWIRWIESMLGPSYAYSLRGFQWNSDDDNLDDFTTYDNERGTARYLCLYGGAWKHWKRWSKVQVALHDLDNVPGIDVTNTSCIDRPFLYDIWKPNCEDLSHGIFREQLNGSCEMINTSSYDYYYVPFNQLPASDTIQDSLATVQMANLLSDYDQVKWVKLAVPVIRDNDNGDGWFNYNDEDPGSSSDYYLEWYVGPQDKQLRYVESIYGESDEPHGNCQVLKPCWPNEGSLQVKLILRDSDKMDEVKEGLWMGLSGLGILGDVPFVGWLAGWLSGIADDGMDINPQDGSDDLTFSVNPEDCSVSDLPGGVQEKPTAYGHWILSSGHDEHWYGDYTAMVGLQVSPAAPTTKVRIHVLDMYGDFNHKINPAYNEKPKVTWYCDGTINKYDLPQRSLDCDTALITHVADSEWQAYCKPYFELTYESYIDADNFAFKLNFDGVASSYDTNSTKYSTVLDHSYDFIYNSNDSSIRNSQNHFLCHSGDSITFKTTRGNKIVDSVRFRITVEDGAYAVLPPPEQIVEYECLDPTASNDEHIKPGIKLINKSNESIPLSTLKVRYWYTSEGYQPESFWVDYSSLPSGSITSKFVKTKPMTGSDGYLEIGFTNAAGQLAAHDSTSEIKLRFNKSDWGKYNEIGDYSYDPTMVVFTPNPKITLYRNSVRIYGDEPDYIPAGQIPPPSITVFAKDEALSESNIVKPRIYVQNTGTVTVPRFELRYHFTAENDKQPILEPYFTPQAVVTLVSEGNNEYYINYHYECPNFGSGVVLPDLNGNVVGLHYGDWSNLDKSNDYSNPGSSTFIQTDKIEVVFLSANMQENPPAQPPQTPVSSVKVYIKDDGISEGNAVKPRVYLINEGASPITGAIDLKYYFTAEDNKTPVVETWWAPQAVLTLEDQGENKYCVRIHCANVSIAQGAAVPGLDGFAFGIHYSDWSSFDKTNDYSNPGSGSWVVTNKIDVVK